jgi:hypothetical protein
LRCAITGSLLCPAWPNRFFRHAASSAGLDPSPTTADVASSILVNGYKFENGTIYDRLDDEGISWTIYKGDAFPQALAISGMTLRLAEGRFRDFEDFRMLLCAEWQTSLEKLSFQSSQRGGRIFTEAKLSSTGFLTKLQVGTQLVPAPIIARLQILGREGLLLAGPSLDDANRTTHHHPRNGSPLPCCSPLMDPGQAKAPFQIIVGARQSFDIRAMKQTSSEVVGDVTKSHAP